MLCCKSRFILNKKMTKSGDNTLQSENIAKFSSDKSVLQEFNLNLHYLLLHKVGAINLYSPVNGFLNNLLFQNADNCISPYYINQKSNVIRGGENGNHKVKEQDACEWKNI